MNNRRRRASGGGHFVSLLTGHIGHVTLTLTLVIASATGKQPEYYYSQQASIDGEVHTYHRQVSPESHDPNLLQHFSVPVAGQSYGSTDPPLSLQKVAHPWSPLQYHAFPAKRLDNTVNTGVSSDSGSGNYDSTGYGAQPNSYDTNPSANSYGGMSSSGSQATGKTFIVLDPTNLIEFDLQISIPFSFDYSFLGIGRRKRDVGQSGDGDPLGDPLSDMVNDLLELNLAKLRTVFMGLGLREQECLEQMICVIHRRPTDYQPLPALISRVLNHDDLKPDFENHFNSINTTSALDYSRYVRAIRRGASGDHPCSGATQCSTAIDNNELKRFNMAAEKAMAEVYSEKKFSSTSQTNINKIEPSTLIGVQSLLLLQTNDTISLVTEAHRKAAGTKISFLFFESDL